MGRDRFCFTGALEDEELREDGDGLEEDGEGPEDLCQVVGVVEDDPEEERGAEEVLDAEGVDGRVMRWPVARCGAERGMEWSTLLWTKAWKERRVERWGVDVPETDFHEI